MRFIAALLVLFSAAASFAQQPGTDPARIKGLHPPAGARIAIVEYYDLECPQCARVAPMVRQAAKQYRIPLVQKDFPLPPTTHPWSTDAAIIARYFDSRSKELGE